MLAAAAVVIVGNEELGAYARQYNSHVVVIPSVVDVTKYCPPAGERHLGDDRVVIGWLGSDPNRGDFAGMESVLDWLADTYGDQVVLRVIGRRPLVMETRLSLEFVGWTRTGSLPALQQFDIGIMPLADTDWNRGKCGFKLIQYLATGTPAVAAPVGVNADIVVHGETGYLARSKEEWQRFLRRLIDDPERRAQMGMAGRHHIEQNYSIQVVLPRLQRVIEQVAV
jgi:glycosyltransferase involved in cell wall biosynthesis